MTSQSVSPTIERLQAARRWDEANGTVVPTPKPPPPTVVDLLPTSIFQDDASSWLISKIAAPATNVCIERQANNAVNPSNTSPVSQDFDDDDMHPLESAPSLPVTMLLKSKSIEETAITHSFRISYSRINMLSIAMSVLASHSEALSFQDLKHSMETLADLVRQIDKRKSLMKMKQFALIETLRTCPFVRFQEDRTNLHMSKVSLVELSSLNQYEVNR